MSSFNVSSFNVSLCARFFATLAVMLLGIFQWVQPASAADYMEVTVQKASVRKTPKPWSSTVTRVRYAQKLEILDQPQSGWYKVRAKNGKEGFIQSTALTEKNTIIGRSSSASRSSSTEVSLAAKGFDPSTERDFKRQNPKLAYRSVDKMEERSASDGQVLAFIKSGKLNY